MAPPMANSGANLAEMLIFLVVLCKDLIHMDLRLAEKRSIKEYKDYTAVEV